MSNSFPLQPTTSTMVDAWYAYVPQWWRAYWGSRIGFSCIVPLDGLLDAGGYAVLAGLPSRAPTDAYSWFGLDRQIFQGPHESDAGYVARLIQWLDLWRHAGSSTALLLAVLSYVAPLQPKVLTVQSNGRHLLGPDLSVWDTYDEGETPFPPGAGNPNPPAHYITPGTQANWVWDSLSLPFFAEYGWMYWRKWIVIFSPPGDVNSPWEAPTATWAPATGSVTVTVQSDPVLGSVYVGSGDATTSATEFHWDDGTCWDWTGTSQDAASLVQLAKTWKSGGCWIPWIIVTYDATMFDESQPFGSSKLPDGNWGYWGKVVADATYGSVYTASRPPSSTCTILAGTQDSGVGVPNGAC